MSVLDFIEKLQKKPVESREKILAVSVIVLMVLLTAVWAQIIRRDFSDARGGDVAGPLKSLWAAAENGFKSATNQFKNLKNL